MLFGDKEDYRATVHGVVKSWTRLSDGAHTHMLAVPGLKRCCLPHSDNRRNFSLVSVVATVMLLNKWFMFPYGHYKSHSHLLSPLQVTESGKEYLNYLAVWVANIPCLKCWKGKLQRRVFADTLNQKQCEGLREGQGVGNAQDRQEDTCPRSGRIHLGPV